MLHTVSTQCPRRLALENQVSPCHWLLMGFSQWGHRQEVGAGRRVRGLWVLPLPPCQVTVHWS